MMIGSTAYVGKDHKLKKVNGNNNSNDNNRRRCSKLPIETNNMVYRFVIIDANGETRFTQPMRLLSASSDKSMMIWSPDPATGVWINEVIILTIII